MAERWKLTVRRGPKVTVSRFGSLEQALGGLERAVDGAGDVRRAPARAFAREVEPVAQVAVRVEVAGPERWLPRVHGGVDLRGDGSAEAWTGRLRREVVQRRDGEGVVDALRRALGAR
jgi:hypothetical protein